MKRAVAAAAAAVALVAAFLVSGAVASHGGPGVKTTRPHFLVPTASGVVVDKILTTGDIVPMGDPGIDDDYQMTGIPDGLGAYAKKGSRWDWLHRGGSREFVAMMNHEIGRSFPPAPQDPPDVDARISRLVIDRETRSVHSAEYSFTGLEGYERFCSATLRIIGGKPFYFTGEEAVPMLPAQPPGNAHEGSSIVMDAETGMWRDTEHFGHLQHENIVPLKLKQWVFLTTEDDFRPGPSYLYAYIAPTFKGAITGRQGALYVFVPNTGEEKSNAEVVSKDQVVQGHWVRLSQHPDNENDVTLKAAATREGAFIFERLEDAAPLPGKESRVFIADTGKAAAGTPTRKGRVYQFDFNWNNPAGGATMRMILNGDAPHSDDIFNPDNMHASERVLMIQEDRESAFRAQHNRVMEYRLPNGPLRSVARVNTTPGTPPEYPNAEPCTGCLPGTWESSGIIDARDVLGKDWWLLDVQAHNSIVPQPGRSLKPNSSVGENGQLVAMYVPGSQGGHHDDDDD